MTSTMRSVALFLLVTTGIFAQHSGGLAGGFAAHSGGGLSTPPPAAGPGRVPVGMGGTGAFPGMRRGPTIRSAYGPDAFGHHFGYGNRSGYWNNSSYGYFAPYLPFYGYDQTLGSYPEENPEGGNVFIFSPSAETSAGPPTAPPQPASAVIHEYKLNPEVAAAK